MNYTIDDAKKIWEKVLDNSVPAVKLSEVKKAIAFQMTNMQSETDLKEKIESIFQRAGEPVPNMNLKDLKMILLMSLSQSDWGGSRPGAGRKQVVELRKPICYRLNGEERAKVDEFVKHLKTKS